MSYEILEQALNGVPLRDVFIVDCHGHLDLWKPNINVAADIDGIIRSMDCVGIDMVCLNKWNCPDLKQANDDVGAAIRKHPDRIVGFAASSPSFGTNWVRDELKRCFEELGCTGMKVHNAYERLPMRDQSGTREYREALEATWEFADERACPVLCHGFLSPDVAGRYPRAKFIAAHACGQRGTADTYADYPNVYFDTACSGTGRGNVEYFAKRVGAERVLYGSDLPYANPAYRIGQVIGTRVGDDDLRKILGGNMARLLGLKHSYAGRPPFHRSDRSNSSHSRRAAGRKGRKL